ncbi:MULTISPECIES: hypothetical protein [unclassified Acidovorax]|uniref:hypothetical protein n=1 Tax=unclassified Acidovorax TaxID=2684926 RepID=UPI000C460273|nr:MULTISPECIES: hypothetical protein [unclassified Acidovorax]PIF16781.1 hypothetical protein CLU87_0686 [Acidovorax sp. 59]PKW04194.1 hypothetical protein CLU89_3874 [Acidovorax sp. 30]
MFFRQLDNSDSIARPFKNSSPRLVEVLAWVHEKSLLLSHDIESKKWSYAEAIDVLQKILFDGVPLPPFFFLQEKNSERNEHNPAVALNGYRLLNLLYQVFYRRSPIDCIESDGERPISFLALDLSHWRENNQRFTPGSIVDIPFLPDTELEPTYSSKLIPEEASYLIRQGLFPLRALCHPGDLSAWQVAMKDYLELRALFGYKKDYSSGDFSPWEPRNSHYSDHSGPRAITSNSMPPHSNENVFARVDLQNDSVIGNYSKRISPMGNMPELVEIRTKQWIAFQQYELNVVWVASREVAASMRPCEPFEIKDEQ